MTLGSKRCLNVIVGYGKKLKDLFSGRSGLHYIIASLPAILSSDPSSSIQDIPGVFSMGSRFQKV